MYSQITPYKSVAFIYKIKTTLLSGEGLLPQIHIMILCSTILNVSWVWSSCDLQIVFMLTNVYRCSQIMRRRSRFYSKEKSSAKYSRPLNSFILSAANSRNVHFSYYIQLTDTSKQFGSSQGLFITFRSKKEQAVPILFQVGDPVIYI